MAWNGYTGDLVDNAAKVVDVMRFCNCSEDRAIYYLFVLLHSNNNPEEAKLRHQTLQQYLTLRPSTPSIRSASGSSYSLAKNGLDSLTDSSSEDGETQFTSPMEVQKPSGHAPKSDEGTFWKASPNTERGNGLSHFEGQGVVPPRPYPETLRADISKSEEKAVGQGAVEVTEVDEMAEEEIVEETEEEKEWDFSLPQIPHPPSLIPGAGQGQAGFSIRDLVGAVQHGATPQAIQNYLGYYEAYTINRHINGTVDGIPAMFYAVGTNSEWVIRTWIAHGGDVKAIHEQSQMPLLAFAIINSENIEADTTLAVTTLLSLGASPDVIPSAFYSPYSRDLPDDGPEEESLEDITDENKKWCTPAARAKLSKAANLSQRYYLERAAHTKKPTIRQKQVAKLRHAEPLLGLPYFLVGQALASNRVLQRFLTHLTVPSRKPLVLVFAGPSGHGKTELARRLGHLLSLPLEIVDCTTMKHESDLFGPRAPYVGSERGTPLNNFIAGNAGERCIIFMDEFEKTNSSIHEALLLPFDNGEYQDRRQLAKINCSKTIWILATNAFDKTIQDFCQKHHEVMFVNDDMNEKMQLMESLSKELREESLNEFSPPVTGRISAFIPFLTFSPSEAAVIAHRSLLDLAARVRARVRIPPGPDDLLLGGVRLRVRRDASVCRILAQEYHPELGARSLSAAVKIVEDRLVEAYLDVDETIVGGEELVDFVVDVGGGEKAGILARMVESRKEGGGDDEKMERGAGKGGN